MVTIRDITPEDRDAINSILIETQMFTNDEIAVALELTDAVLFNKTQKDYIIHIAELEGKTVGYICYGPTPVTVGTYDIYWIAVAPHIQKRGVGRKLVSYVEDEIASKNGRLIIIETSSQHKYEPTRNFYIRTHYTMEARIKDFYSEGDDRLIYVKRIKGQQA
jgi:ribosomal protein S18 acetylase RimI-like enzyme